MTVGIYVRNSNDYLKQDWLWGVTSVATCESDGGGLWGMLTGGAGWDARG